MIHQQNISLQTITNKRLIKQLTNLINSISLKQIKQIQVLSVKESSAIFAFPGPIDSPYEGFWFRLLFQWNTNYPFQGPKINFIDKIWSPYVQLGKGQICMEYDYSPQLTTQKYIFSIMSLMSERKVNLNRTGFLNVEAASQMRHNYKYFFNHAKKYCSFNFYKQQKIYDESLKGKTQDYIIRAEGKQLKKMIEADKRGMIMFKEVDNRQLNEYLNSKYIQGLVQFIVEDMIRNIQAKLQKKFSKQEKPRLPRHIMDCLYNKEKY